MLSRAQTSQTEGGPVFKRRVWEIPVGYSVCSKNRGSGIEGGAGITWNAISSKKAGAHDEAGAERSAG